VLLPALIGLAGVLIGALVTSGVAYLGDRAHRAADAKTAKRLIAAEIRVDTNTLVFFSAYGKLNGYPLPRTVAWDTQAPNLARYTDDSTWGTVNTFYYALLQVEHSLTTRCIGSRGARQEIRTAAKLGNDAYVAMTGSSIPDIEQVTKTYACYFKR
jgi:hypothetical protein